jgi:hypothetical protein
MYRRINIRRLRRGRPNIITGHEKFYEYYKMKLCLLNLTGIQTSLEYKEGKVEVERKQRGNQRRIIQCRKGRNGV